MNRPSASASEGRASMARPSLRSLPFLLVVLAQLVAVQAAQAIPPIPVLTGTDPASPSTDVSPFVHGSSTGVISSALPGPRLSAVGLSSELEGRTIALYANQACEGAPVSEGSAEALDTTGIQITVVAEQVTYISANQSDTTGASNCSNALMYEQVKELPPPQEPPSGPAGTSGSPPAAGNQTPPAAPRLRTVPGGVANDNTPLVTGTAPGAASVRIFADPSCDGAPVASGSASQFAAGIPVRVADNVVLAFYGISVGPGGAKSRCSDPAYYVEDSMAPHTRITMGPASRTRSRTAIFRFTDVNGNLPGTTFFCKVDRRRWKSCSSPLRLRGLRQRRYLVEVKATDLAGNVERKPAKRRFRVVPPA